MKIKKRGLSQNEKYACSVQDIKNIFSDVDSLFVSFGWIGKKFSFDHAFTNRPLIKGYIIASVSYNKRLKISVPFNKDLNPIHISEPNLCFYAIRDDKYETKHREEFCTLILPEMRKWLDKVLIQRNNGLPGVYELLIEWTGSNIKLHDCRFK